MTLAVGTCLQDGRYQIRDILQATDVDITYQAIHTYLSRSVILKELRSDVHWVGGQPLSNPALLTQLNRLSHCHHTCLAEVLDCFEEGDRVYLVLPFTTDPTLEEWLNIYGPVSPTTALDLLKPLVKTLKQLHRQQVVYGELTLKTLRYGLATHKLVADVSWRMLLTGLLAPNPTPLPQENPNQSHSPTVSSAIDTLGLAQITYSLLTGQSWPFGVSANAAVGIAQLELDQSRWPSSLLLAEDVRMAILAPLQSPDLAPSEWFMHLQMAVLVPSRTIELTTAEANNNYDSCPQAHTTATADTVVASDTGLTTALAPVATSENHNQPRHDQPRGPKTPAEIQQSRDQKSGDQKSGDQKSGDPKVAPQQRRSPHWFRLPPLPYLLGAMSIVTMVSGGLFGYAFRVQDAEQLQKSPIFGSDLFGSDQEFPPSEYWPGVDSNNVDVDAVLFEQPVRQGQNRPVVRVNENNTVNNSGRVQEQRNQTWGQRAADDVILNPSPEVETEELQEAVERPSVTPNNAVNDASTNDASTNDASANNASTNDASANDANANDGIEMVLPVVPPPANGDNQPQAQQEPGDRPLVEPILTPTPTPTEASPPAVTGGPSPETTPPPRIEELPPTTGQDSSNQLMVPNANPSPAGSNGAIPLQAEL
ncbi:MAG: hypothetical protein F6K30_09055 [Cyanothece sp. SIO2G6]|nr:hypothetical protein [Cyanothece sp. SIO2G6]